MNLADNVLLQLAEHLFPVPSHVALLLAYNFKIHVGFNLEK